MAQLVKLAPFVGPNEEMASEHLRKHLPDDWWIIANRQLDTQRHEDIDFFVLANNNLFVIEEKSWGPKILLGDLKWTVINGKGIESERKSPFRDIVPKTKIVAGWLREKIPGFKNTKGHKVIDVVLLTHPKIEVTSKIGFKPIGYIFKLNEICQELIDYDAQNNDGIFSGLKKSILALLLEQKERSVNLPRIENFKIIREIDVTSLDFPMNKLRKFEAEDELLRQEHHLNCLILDPSFVESESEWSDFAIRDFSASEKLNATERAWKQGQPFKSAESNYLVLPFKKPEGALSLAELLLKENSDIAKLYFDNIKAVLIDALKALNTIHHAGILHRNINVENIWIVKGSRIVFNDFYSSHIDNHATIAGFVKPSISNLFSAPEIKENIFKATAKSDLYSLAKTFEFWIRETSKESSQNLAIEEILVLLNNCFTDEPEKRIGAEELLTRLEKSSKIANSLEEQNEVETDVSDGLPDYFPPEFKLDEKLGSGSTGTSWRAQLEDEDNLKRLVVIKEARDAKAFKRLTTELLMSQQIIEIDHCSHVLDKKDSPNFGFIWSTYLPGVTLGKHFSQNSPNTDAIIHIFISTIEVLKQIHSKQLVHGDISPSNIIYDESREQSQLIDFGTLTKFGVPTKPFGTPNFYAPEIVNLQQVDERADFYSLAATFVSLILGRPHRLTNLGDINEAFEPISLKDEERLQHAEETCQFIDILFTLLSREKELRADIDDVLARVRAIGSRTEAVTDFINPNPKVNRFVPMIRSLYTNSRYSSKEAIAERGDKEFLSLTYVQTNLERVLLPQLVKGDFKVLLLTGNPGGGKTSYIQTIQEKLLAAGGSLVNKENEASIGPEWQVELSGKKFHAILDASQSNGDRDANEIVLKALKNSIAGEEISLIAINDGRLKTFFRIYGEEFPQIRTIVNDYFSNIPNSNSEFLIIDLKGRSVVNLELQGFLRENINKLTASELWTECGTCTFNKICPIISNRNALINSSVQEKLSELTLFTHLRRNELPNFRRIRSAIAYLITSDLDCNLVAENILNGNADFEHNNLANLAFAGESGDSLVDSWQILDPGQKISPKIRNRVSSKVNLESVNLDSFYSKTAREIYFGLKNDESGEVEREISTYRHAEEFYEYLNGGYTHLRPLLHGISNISGQRLPYKNGLMIAESNSESGWSVLKIIPEEEFSIERNIVRSEYLETINDELILKHGEHRLHLNINSFELILRSNSGEIFNDFASAAIRYEIEMFAAKILRKPQESIVLLDAGGSLHTVNMIEKIISLESLNK